MVRYILERDHERIEVLEGREDRRDQLIAAGYKWVNKPVAAEKPVKPLVDKSKDSKDSKSEG